MTDTNLPEERRQEILRILNLEGKVTASKLSKELKVSEDTIRRDLKDLSASGQLVKVHGGALPRSPVIPPYTTREGHNTKEKLALAKVAAKHIQSGQVVLMDGGTTVLEVARQLASNIEATILTNSPPILMTLAQHPSAKVIMLGGTLDKKSVTVMGSETHESLMKLRPDICILGVCSLHGELGMSASSYEEANLKRLMIQNSAEVIAVTTQEKLNKVTPFIICPIQEVDQLITENNIPDNELAAFQAAGIQITKVKL